MGVERCVELRGDVELARNLLPSRSGAGRRLFGDCDAVGGAEPGTLREDAEVMKAHLADLPYPGESAREAGLDVRIHARRDQVVGRRQARPSPVGVP